MLPTLPHVLSGHRREVHDSKAGLVSFYVDGPASPNSSSGTEGPPPLLLVHSINAAASAHEVKPLFDAYKAKRPTYAIDLPGYGHSDRSDRPYRQGLMVDAVLAVLDQIRSDHPDHAIDVLAVSLASEFIAKAALAAPESIRSLALVSPTGFAKITATHGPPEADLGKPRVHRIISLPLLGQALFKLLTIRPSIRFFLKKTWGSDKIDEEMFQHAARLSRTPGAHRAPLYFVAGYLFSADIRSVFRSVTQPVWMSHGVRGDFVDYSQTDGITEKANWHVTVFDTGAMPYFEVPEQFVKDYDEFLHHV
ncbi:MAG: alpha/beta hydrolase [Wenzhouxiangella sp.]|nr:alpha/beta hydrolase [Wenzhouxiangella sp.]